MMSQSNNNLPSVNDFIKNSDELPSIDDFIVKESLEELPSVKEFIKEDKVEEEIVEEIEEPVVEKSGDLTEILRLINDVRKDIPEIPEIKSYDKELEKLCEIVDQVRSEIPVVPEIKYYDAEIETICEQIDSVKEYIANSISSLPEVKYYDNQIEVLEEKLDNVKNTISELPEVRYYENDLQSIKEEIQNVQNNIPSFPKWINEINEVPDFSWIGKTFSVIEDDFTKINNNVNTLKDNFNLNLEQLSETIDTKRFESKVEIDEINKNLQEAKDNIWKELRESSLKIWEYHKEFKDDDRKLKKQIVSEYNSLKQNLEGQLKKVNQESIKTDELLLKYFAELKEQVSTFPEVKYYDDEIVDVRKEIGSVKVDINELYKIVRNIKSSQKDLREDLREGLLNEPAETKNSDPLTPLDKNFATLDDLQKHYRLFINRIQQQLASIGGGGETQLKYLDDIVGIATNASSYDGKYLKYNHSLGNFEFADVDISNDSWAEGTFGPYTLGSVGIGTTNPTTKLTVSGVLGFGNQQNILIGDNDTGARIVSDLSLGNTIPTNNFFAGPGAGKSSGYSFFSNASNNTFIGFEAGWGNISGNDNICIGALAGRNNNSGQNNIFLGLSAGFGGGGNSVCIGENAGYTNAGSFNNFIGLNAGYYNLSGFSNNFLGYNSGLNNTNGGYNNFIGDYSGYSNTTGNYNTFIGGRCGISTSASNKIILGYGYNISSLFDSPDTTKNTQFAVGVRTDDNDSRYWLVGNENFDIGIGVTNPQSKLHVGGTITIGIGTVGINSVFSTTDIASWYYTNKSKTPGNDGTPQAIYVGASGNAMFMVGSTNDTVYQYILSTPYDVNTAGASVASFSVATQETGPVGIDFDPAGTKMFVSGIAGVAPLIVNGEYVHEYSLSTAWTVSSAGYTTSYNVTQDTSPQGVTFGNSGSKMYIVGSTNDTIYQYSLSTPYSLASGVTYDNISLVVGTLETNPTDISFNSTGTVLWIVGNTNDRIYEFRLRTAWDISTAVFYDDVYIGFNELAATGLQIIPEQNVAYIVGTTNDTVYQYSTNTPAIEIASSGISSVSSIVLNNETRIKDKLYVKGLAHFDNNIVTQGTLQVDSAVTASGSLNVGGTLTGNATVTFDTTTSAINFGTSQTTGTLILGGTSQTGTITVGRSTVSQTVGIATGVSGVGTTKTINLGTGGLSGSFTQINIGPTAGVGTVTVNSGTNLGIGTARATSPLHVVGSSLITGISTVGLGSTSTPPSNSQMSFELTSDTNLRIKVRGTDGVLRSANITLA